MNPNRFVVWCQRCKGRHDRRMVCPDSSREERVLRALEPLLTPRPIRPVPIK